MTKHRTWGRAATGVGLLAVLGACGGTVQFSGSTPFEVAGQRPAPEPQTKRVVVTEDAIVIHDKIHFEFDKATIKAESFDLLDEIASVINDNPRIQRINIEGHTDSMGRDEYNEKLSDARAEAVRTYLVEHGIAADRLTHEGFGEARPIASNDSDEGRQKNRRVEFIITEQQPEESVYEVDLATGARTKVAGAGVAAKSRDKAKGEPGEDKTSVAEMTGAGASHGGGQP